jgi:GntR family transcriptional regulator
MTIEELGVTLTPASPIPLYHQIADQLQKAIETGRLTKGDFLPSEIDLAERWSVSRPTARRAIQQLVDHGMLVRRRGVGTQVIASHVQRGMRLSSLYDDLEGSGRHPTTKVLRLERAVADGLVARELAISVGDEVYELDRIRYADSRPLALMHNWVPADLGQQLTVERLETGGLYAQLRVAGVRPMVARQVIEAKAANDEEALLLGLSVGAPVLVSRRVLQDDSGRHVEYASHSFDATQYSIEMTVVEGS